MLRRPNPYANVSLERPDVMQANFDVPQMNPIPIPAMEAPDTGAQVGQLGETLLGLKKKRFGAQGDQIKEALSAGGGGKFAGF